MSKHASTTRLAAFIGTQDKQQTYGAWAGPVWGIGYRPSQAMR